MQFLQGIVRHSPDAYLDKKQELLEARRGVEVGKATVWRALRRSGFTMKKARIFLLFSGINIKAAAYIETSLLEMRLSEVRPSELYIAINMVPSLHQSRLFSWMKALSIVELLFMERHGHCQGNVLYEIPFLSEGDGKEMNIQLIT